MKNKTYLVGNMASATDIGKVRISNEDATLALVNTKGNVLLVVCDGMGGVNKGEFASMSAIKILKEAFEEKESFKNVIDAKNWVKNTLHEINEYIFNTAVENETYKGMGTTITLALIVDTKLIVAQIGDSRCYRLKDGFFEQLTEDQTYVAYLFRTGKITYEQMLTHPKRHILLNALGYNPIMELDIATFRYKKEKILLCSDGLYNNVKVSQIANIVKGNDDTTQKVNELISEANANGGSDNIAVVLWEASN